MPICLCPSHITDDLDASMFRVLLVDNGSNVLVMLQSWMYMVVVVGQHLD
jgi:hypothetical protein